MRNFLNCLLLLFICTACGTGGDCSGRDKTKQWWKDNGRLKVLCSIAMIGDVVEQVGGDRVDNHTLISGQLDPHSYQLVKGDDEKLQFAELIFYNGLGLEHGPSFRRRLQESSNAHAYGESIVRQDPSVALHIAGVLDPHMWMDISLWARGVDEVVEVLSQARPQYAEEFAQRGVELKSRMMTAHEEVREELQAVPSERRYLVSSHDAFNYFARAYLADGDESSIDQWGQRCQAPEGLAPESQLSSRDIQEILEHVARYDIRVLFTESNVSRDSVRKILDAGQSKGLQLRMSEQSLYGDAMACKGQPGDSHLSMIQHNGSVLAKEFLADPLEKESE